MYCGSLKHPAGYNHETGLSLTWSPYKCANCPPAVDSLVLGFFRLSVVVSPWKVVPEYGFGWWWGICQSMQCDGASGGKWQQGRSQKLVLLEVKP